MSRGLSPGHGTDVKQVCADSVAGPIRRGTARTLARVPRLPRLRPAGGIFHITARGNRRQDIFLDDADRERFLALFTAVVARYGWSCHAYCLMRPSLHKLWGGT